MTAEHAERLVHSIVIDTFELSKVDISSLGKREREDLEFAAAQLGRLLQKNTTQFTAAE
jgi:hypothetical protein